MFRLRKLIACFMFFVIFINLISASETDFKQELYKNNQKIKELYESEVKINNEIESLERQIVGTSEEISRRQKVLEEYNSNIEQYENKIFDLNKTIEGLNNEILTLERDVSKNVEEIKNLENEVEKFKDLISKRLRNLYIHIDNSNPLMKLFYTSDNVSDFADRIFNINKFMKLDKEIIEKVIQNISDIKNKNDNIEFSKKMIDNKIKFIDDKIRENDENLKVLEEQKQLKQNEIDEINKLNEELKNKYNSLSDEKKMVQEEIVRIHQDNFKIQEEFKKYLDKLNETNREVKRKVKYGKYIWPARGRVTCPYGKRQHPITKKESFHTGIDIGGNKNDNIFASLGGEVVTSGWYNSVYGNVVIINHGNNIQTFYAHLEKTLVKVGQEVSQGEIIAKMGTTGLSTGPHLHFEIRINGEHVDPLKRLKQSSR